MDRKRLKNSITAYMFNRDIDIDERLSRFFIYIGIVAAFLGVIINAAAGASALGIIATLVIAIGAPSLLGVTVILNKSEKYGQFIAIGLSFIMPFVWIGSGGSGGGVNVWLVYELFFIALFASKKELPIYLALSGSLEIACFVLEAIRPDLVYHFPDQKGIYISVIGSIVIVSATIIITVIIQKSLYNYEKEQGDSKENFSIDFVMSIASIIDARDGYAGGHSKRVASCALALGRRLGMTDEELFDLGYVGLLHDIGKIGVPDAILNKPGKLTEEEFEIIRRHPRIGADILDGLYFIPNVKEGALCHHERYDGKGYPNGLSGEDIPYFARIIAVADAYDAMSTNRVYHKKMTRKEIIGEFERGKGTQFDPNLAGTFIDMLEKGFDNSEQVDLFANRKYRMETMISSHVNELRTTLDTLEKEEKAAAEKAFFGEKTDHKAFEENEEWSKIYESLKALSERSSGRPVLVRIGFDPSYADPAELPEMMDHLKQATHSTIRHGDICTRISDNAYHLYLINASATDAPGILERIEKRYRELCPPDRTCPLSCQVEKTDN